MSTVFWRFVAIVAGYYVLSLSAYCFLKAGKRYRQGKHDDEAVLFCLGVVCLCAAEVLAIAAAKM